MIQSTDRKFTALKPHPSSPDYQQYGPFRDREDSLQYLLSTNHTTRNLLQNVSEAQLSVPFLPHLNPPLWEFGHINWFHEFWVHRQDRVDQPSIFGSIDQTFNSSIISHQDRWTVPIPSLEVLLDQNECLMAKTLDILQRDLSVSQGYFLELALVHQAMHNEAFAHMWQSLGYHRPFSPYFVEPQPQISLPSAWLTFPASEPKVGADVQQGFIFDNEKWAHVIPVGEFTISSHAVSNGDYQEFVQAQRQGLERQAAVPRYWYAEGSSWQVREFDRLVSLEERKPVQHITLTQAQNYCAWRGQRLPTEHELGMLLASSAQAWQASGLWEWTSSPFLPFQGFTPDPYLDYSQPWFDHKHHVLKGWSSYTSPLLRRPSIRNFYQAQRSDAFCSFRTCLLKSH